MSEVNRENRRNRRKRAKQKKNEKKYFSNDISINEFSQNMIKDLTSLKTIKEQLKEVSMAYGEVENMENEAFNLLINKIELEKGNSKVEVGVIGSFSSGKSTFINSLFGESVCPMSVKPTTSSITKFFYGYKKKITIDGKKISQEEYENRSKHLEGDTQNTETNYIEYAYPFERLSSIVLYDTPGFNNNQNDNDAEVTMKTLESVDVIFFIIDISKGTIDKVSVERLRKLKNKRMYCILNKSDLKSLSAIEKIKEEIISEQIFLEVIEYSAFKVLEFAETNYISDHFKHIEEELIPKKIDFTTTTKGVYTEIKGRFKSKKEYRLYINNNEYLIDDFYIHSKKQRARVEKMLNMISESKHDTLKHKLKVDIYNYNQKSRSIVEEKLNYLDNTTFHQGVLYEFEADINQFRKELYQFEKNHVDKFYNDWNYTFLQACFTTKVLEKEKFFWSTPYSKIYFDKSIFEKKIENTDALKYMETFIYKWIYIFRDKYNCILLYTKENILQEALSYYSNLHDSKNYILNKEEEGIYFKNISEARNYLRTFSGFESKDKISQLHYFLDDNQENIESKRRELYGQDLIKTKNIKNLKIELNNFMKEKKDYVNNLQK